MVPGKFHRNRSYRVETHSEQTDKQTFFFIYINILFATLDSQLRCVVTFVFISLIRQSIEMVSFDDEHRVVI